MSRCATDDEIAGFVEGELPEPESRRIAEHIDTCASCREMVALGVAADSKSDSAPPPREIAVGDQLGRFIVLGLVGKGGMGRVFAAHDPDLDRKVALKLVHAEKASAEVQARLMREAQAMARLHHPEVITVYDVGTVGDDEVFIAMEFVDGGTLRSWLHAEPRSVGAIVARFARAGDGLAAAHAVGLVHRDFKPDNVLVGSDGRQRVTDFGLARATADQATTPPGELSPTSPLHASLTASGALVGTPAYMAPEQLDGDPVDGRADQFSLCVSLYQALYGELPFAGDNARAIRAAIARDRVRAAPRRSRVPGALRAVLLRGLKVRPEDRFPSMNALVATLRARVRRRLAPLLGIVAAMVLLLAGGLGHSLLMTRQRRCAGAERQLTGVWDVARRAQLHETFTRSKLSFAESVWTTTAQMLDTYAGELTRLRVEACAATELRHEQPESVRALREACLGDRQNELDGLLGIFASADAGLVARAPQVASQLASFDPCNDIAALQAGRAPPRTREQGAAAEKLRPRLSLIWAQYLAGKYNEAATGARAVVADARALGYAPLESEALYRLALSETGVGDLKAAERDFTEAVVTALRGRYDAQAELAWGQLTSLVGISEGRLREGLLWARFTEALEERRGRRDHISIGVLSARAQLQMQQGQLDEAAATLARALVLLAELKISPLVTLQYEGDRAIILARQWRFDEAAPIFRRVLDELERLLGKEHPNTIAARENLTQVLNQLRRYDQALPLAERCVEELVNTTGEADLGTAQARFNLSESLAGLGRGSEALVQAQSALAVLEKRLGRDHPALADYLVAEGIALTLLRRTVEAVPLFERALAMHDKAHDSALDRAPTMFALARALLATGHDRARALELAGAARAAHDDAARAWGGNNRARADEIAAWVNAASVEAR